MAQYESELTAFLRKLKSEHPEVEREQMKGRALWWDKHLDPDDLQRWEASRVRMPAYVYFAAEPLNPASGS